MRHRHPFLFAILVIFTTQANVTFAQDKTDKPAPQLDWYDVKDFGVEGRILLDQERLSWFDRLPASAENHVRKPVWGLSRDSAGMMARFETDATSLYINYRVTDKNLAMPHMPATGVSGVDFYARDTDGKWKWVNVTKPNAQEMNTLVIENIAPGKREFAAYLPLYNGIEFLKIGVPEGAHFKGLAPREEKPIVFYGTSITHGACASRPGMVHTAILGRWLDRPVINLGFSGNGTMDKEVCDYLVQLDPAVYVIDCLPNMNAAAVTAKCIPLVKQLRAARPETPIILVEDRRNTNDWILPARSAHHTANHAALKKAYEQLQEDGVKNLYYIPGDTLYGDDADGATDGSHASDLGFMRQAETFLPVIKQALGEQ